MMSYRRKTDASARFDERMRREDESPRLQEHVPLLQSLRLELAEYQHDGRSPLMSHVRHIVVGRAPALFHILCGDRDCVDGGFDITREILHKLRTAATTFDGKQDCRGTRHGDTCQRRLEYTVVATYAEVSNMLSDPGLAR